MKTSFYCFFFALFAMHSCSDGFIDESNTTPPSASLEENPELRSQGDGIYESLGYGYDITGDYMDYYSIKRKVLNIEAFVNDFKNYDVFDNKFIGQSTTRLFYGEDAYSYTNQIIKNSNFDGSVAANASKDKGSEASEKIVPSEFSGTISGHYGTSSNSMHSYSTKYSFARGDILRKHRQYTIYSTPNNLSNYLSLGFIEALQTLSPDDVIREFGTHVMLDITVGGIYSAYYKSAVVETTSSEEKTKSVKAGLNLSYKGIGLDFSTNMSTTEIQTSNRRNADWSCVVICNGGNTSGTKVTITPNSPATTEINYSSWESSVGNNTSVLVDVNWNRTFPIYDFISDPVKKAEIEAAVERYLKGRMIKLLDIVPLYRYFSDINHDHFYVNTWKGNLNAEHYYYEGVECYILKKQQEGMVPLYRYYSGINQDHFYVNTWEGNMHAGDYMFEQIEGYIYEIVKAETVPLYRYFNPLTRDHFYTTVWGGNTYIVDHNYIFERIEGYAFPAK